MHFKLIIAGDDVGYVFDLNDMHEGAQDNLHASEYFHQYQGMSKCIKIYVLTIRTHDQIFLVGNDDIHLPDEQDAMEFGVYTDGFDVTFDDVAMKFSPVLRAHEQAGRVRSMELEIHLASTQG